MAFLRSLLFIVGTTASMVLAAQETKAASCCAAIGKALPRSMMLPSSSLYEETNHRYYIEAQTKLEPACRVLPSSAAEVAQIVSIATEKQCHFAVASGKHWVISGGSNIGPDGFTIDLMFLNGTSLSKDHSIASIGPGLRAGAVYDFLDQYGLYVAVGRDRDVGIGGFLAGGGISFPTFEHGFGSSTVVNFQVVLASGEVANVNESSHKDLFWAIKSGSTNYGIITRFDMLTYPSPAIWGGFLGFPLEESKAVMANFPAAVKYLSKHPSDAGSMLITFDSTLDKFIVTQANYRGAEASPPLYKILFGDEPSKATLDTFEAKPFLQFLEEVKFPTTVKKTRWQTYNVKPDGDFAVQVWEKGQELWGKLNSTRTIPGLAFDTVIQPMLKNMRCATYAGPVCNEEDGDLMLLLTRAYWDDAGDKQVEATMQEWKRWVHKEAKKRNILSDFLYTNYMGSTDESPYTGLPEDVLQRMLDVQSIYDPEAAFGDLWKGGFKLPSHT